MADVNSAACPESAEKQYRDKLLALIKKEVKHIMEEAVTKKSVHEESSSVSSLCCAIDACLTHGLKRRALGLFKTNSSTALIQKVSKNYEPAAQLYRMVQEFENSDSSMLSSMSCDSPTHRAKDRKKTGLLSNGSVRLHKFLWIKIALFQKKLGGIIDHLVANSSKYYDKEALLSDPVEGEIFASLLIGPCALDYSKIKSQDHFWSDPSADELLQRHRLSNHPVQNGSLTPPSGRRPLGVSYRWPTSSLDFGGKPVSNAISNGSDGESTSRSTSLACSPREFVDSLHQNCKSTLLYGKNNVVVRAKGQESPVPGYLSLHSTPFSLLIKWTPNQIMHASNSDQVSASPPVANHLSLWDLAMSVNMEEIVYLHCHQSESGGTIVLVGQDGVQKPPMMFPAGGHLLAFLSCLETGLQPFGQLDPPLAVENGKGKVFPKLRLKGRAGKEKSGSSHTHEERPATSKTGLPDPSSSSDYVFRIIANFQRPESITQEMFEPNASQNCVSSPGRWSSKAWLKRTPASDSSTSTCSTLSRSTDEAAVTVAGPDRSIASMCESMRRQIMCRAFYGWLTHTRHIRTVRNHLSELVNAGNDLLDENFVGGLRKEAWDGMHDAKGCIPPDRCEEINCLLYFGGCEPSIRPAVWPYLLGHYDYGMTEQERHDRDTETQQHYEITMTEWLAIEVIVKQRDKEIAAANLAKLSSESTAESSEFATAEERNDSNDVFSESVAEQSDFKSESKAAKSSCKKEPDRKVGILRQQQLESRSSQTVSEQIVEEAETDKGVIEEPTQLTANSASQCPSPTSSNGGVYSTELLDLFSLNLHRIEKDVQRCDRNYPFYMEKENLEKLRNIMCTYVWENLDQGYVQGMCDLVAPLLVIFEDEVMTYSCFIDLMKRMVSNFPYGGAMDAHFANLRSLIQVLDYELFELMHANGDYTHFYFCYRWFLLDFKRELLYEDVFRVWEAIWSAKSVSTSNFVLFIAAALVEFYRDIIIGNNMDFTDIIKFFNEMAERHDAKAILRIARGLVREIQTMVDEL